MRLKTNIIPGMRKYCSEHKKISALAVFFLILIIALFWRNFTNRKETRYVLAAVQRGSILSSVSGSGQISASNQIEIKAKVSGDVQKINVRSGQEVKAGDLLVQLDSTDAQKAVRDAELNLHSAVLALEKLHQPAEKLSLLQADNALAQAQETKRKSEEDLDNDYDDGFNAVTNAFLDLPSVMSGVYDVLFATALGNGQWNVDYYAGALKTYGYEAQGERFRSSAYASYNAARSAYDINFSNYKATSRFSSTSTVETLIAETYETTKKMAEAVKSANNLIQFYKDKITASNAKVSPSIDTYLSSLNSYTSKTNDHLLSLSAAQSALENSKNAILSAQRSLEEKKESLAALKAGSDPLDIESQQLSVDQRENALSDAKIQLADSYIRAPFDGIAAKVNVKQGDSITSGTSVVTFIAQQQVAQISLNEIDAAKIKVGQKANMTFDAIDGLEVAGEVSEIDTVGTVSQGVVTYNVKIILYSQDGRIKPGMSVSAIITTEMKEGVLLVPNGAVKQSDNINYVEKAKASDIKGDYSGSNGIVLPMAPTRQTVKIGIANDDYTEVTEGLNEGEFVVTRIIANSQKQSAQSSGSIFGMPGSPRPAENNIKGNTGR